MRRTHYPSDFIDYLATSAQGEEGEHLPSLLELSKHLQVSIARLREQLEVAKALGLVEVRPKTGMRRMPFSFLPAIRHSLSYGIRTDPACFDAYSDLRNHVESAYWMEAVSSLTADDKTYLQNLVESAWEKLHGSPVQIPHAEHRELHLAIYRRLANPFVQGLLEAYWEADEEVGLNRYADYHYLEQVWRYHQTMVAAICSGDYPAGYQALLEHKKLIHDRPLQAGATPGVDLESH